MSYPGYEAQKKAILKYQKSRERIILSVKREVKEDLKVRAGKRGMSLSGYILDVLMRDGALPEEKEVNHESDRGKA